MAENGRDILEQSKSSVDKEIRLRVLKDRQNEERQRKLEEIKAQAMAAQRFKEQKEQERRKRLEELRIKDDVKRQQVEEKKRAINEAERNRLEFILKRNQEREQRIEAKKRSEKSNIVFAFGSSTPRMLEPEISLSFWGHRRATSIQNITSSTSLTRRQTERDIDVGNKKRATSATGLERSGETTPTIPAGCASGYTGRRRTDLVPTIPSRDASFSSSRKSLNHSPGRAYSMTRLDQLAKPRKRHDLPSLAEGNSLSSYNLSVTRSMSHLAVNKSGPSPTRRTLNKTNSSSMQHLADGPAIVPRTTRSTQLREQKLHSSSNCSDASSRPSSSLSQQSTNSLISSASVRHRLSTIPRKPRPASIAITGITHDLKLLDKSGDNKPPISKMRKSVNKSSERIILKNKVKSPVDSNNKDKVAKTTQSVASKTNVPNPQDAPLQNQIVKQEETLNKENVPETSNEFHITMKNVESFIENEKNVIGLENELSSEKFIQEKKDNPKIEEPIEEATKALDEIMIQPLEKVNLDADNKIKNETNDIVHLESEDDKEIVKVKQKEEHVELLNKIPENKEVEQKVNVESKDIISSEMTTSQAKVRIQSEEEAKAALAERRRIIREEAERQAEIERQRLEAEARAEIERQQREEEQVRQLIELQRQTEQERLQEAIKEAQKREEEEKFKREEEQRLKLLKEEAEKKAKEDAERQKAELQERLKNEEKEREARRKRVEAIMLRTRGKNNANITSQKSTDDKNENKSESEENKIVDEGSINGTKIEQQKNGTAKNDVDVVDNIIEEEEIIKNANSINTTSRTDSINSNDGWRDSQQFGNFVLNNNS